LSEEKNINRRDFLGIATFGIAGLIGLGLGIPAIIYLIGPSLRKSDILNWLSLGPASKVELDSPTLYKISVEQQTGWISNVEEKSFYVFTENGRDYVALSNICTHLGCRVRWIEDRQEYVCPCHNGVFDKEGNVVSGPPPRPLDRFEVKVVNDQLMILGG
jgi:quinol---cytochrome c reductase iron-sulfur subunit, bacillus type